MFSITVGFNVQKKRKNELVTVRCKYVAETDVKSSNEAQMDMHGCKKIFVSRRRRVRRCERPWIAAFVKAALWLVKVKS